MHSIRYVYIFTIYNIEYILVIDGGIYIFCSVCILVVNENCVARIENIYFYTRIHINICNLQDILNFLWIHTNTNTSECCECIIRMTAIAMIENTASTNVTKVCLAQTHTLSQCFNISQYIEMTSRFYQKITRYLLKPNTDFRTEWMRNFIHRSIFFSQ